jgi:hypothetical protein
VAKVVLEELLAITDPMPAATTAKVEMAVVEAMVVLVAKEEKVLMELEKVFINWTEPWF